MLLSDHFLGMLELGISVGTLLYLFFLLILLPILPVKENIFEIYTLPQLILLGSGIFGLVFIGSLSLFTLIVLHKEKCRSIRNS